MSDAVATLTIRQLANGQVTIEGPIDNTLLTYGLLECAKDALRNYSMEKAARSSIQIASQMPQH